VQWRQEKGVRLDVNVERSTVVLSKMVSISIAFVAVFLFGCGSAKQNGTTITFWAIGAEGERVAPFVREFESLHPDIHVNLETIPWGSAHDKLLTAYAGNATPDICQLGNTWIAELQAMNAIIALDSSISKSSVVRRENYFDGIWETNVVAGKVYGIPWYVDTRALFYRKDLLAQAGMTRPPEDWDELLEAASLLTVKHEKENKTVSYGLYLPVNPGLEWVEVFFAWQNGGEILKDNDCYANVESPEVREGFAYYLKFFEKGYSPKESNMTTNLYEAFASGYIGMFISGPWNVYEIKQRFPSLSNRWAVALLPANKNRASNAGGSSLVIFRSSKDKEAAWKLIEFLSTTEIQRDFYKASFDLPAVKEAWADSSLLGDPNMRAFYKQLESAKPFPRIPEWEQIADKMGQWIEAAVWGRYTLDEALAEMTRDINRVLEKRRWMLKNQKTLQ